MLVSNIWFKVFTIYQKDPRFLSEWVSLLKKDVYRAIKTARRFVEFDVVPEAVVLGFSPQILVAITAVNYPKPVLVLTSPEVAYCRVSQAKYSHEVLKLMEDNGLVKEVIVELLAPSNKASPVEIVRKLLRVMEKINATTIDISGGTQLVAIAASKTNKKLTYTYPLGTKVKIYELKI